MDVVNVIYFGQDIKTLMVLENEKHIEVKGVAKIGDFLKYATFNPINRLFQFIYSFHLKEKNKLLKIIFNYVFQAISPGSSGLFKKYREYLNHLVKNEIKIIEYKIVPKLQNLSSINKFFYLLLMSGESPQKKLSKCRNLGA